VPKDDEYFMRLTMETARRGIEKGELPFAATVVKDGEVLSSAHTVVFATNDPTAHAEVTAIREACRKLGTHDLSGSVVYTVPCATCPMCFSALNWAKVSRLVYGAEVGSSTDPGLAGQAIDPETMRDIGGSPLEIVGGILMEENLAIYEYHREWNERRGEPALESGE
jgi:tRNA(Arg) A34 adenosine deaminase TadA